MTNTKTKLIPMVARIEVETTVEDFLEYWYDNNDDEPTQEDYEDYCFEYAEAHFVNNGTSNDDIVLVEKTNERR
jgi:hypothetical protein